MNLDLCSSRYRLACVIGTALLLCMGVVSCQMRGDMAKGAACLQLGDYAAAVDFYGAVLKKNPDTYRARVGMGKALLQKAYDLNDTLAWRQALMYLESARTLSPEDDCAELLAEAWLEHGRIQLVLGDTLRALSDIARAIEYAPAWVEPVNLAGIVYYQRGDSAKAGALFRRAMAIDSLHPSAYFNLGMVYWQAGILPMAHDWWAEALRRAPDDQDILYWFARAEKESREADKP